MPSSREVVINSALSGAELKELIRADIERLLTAEGMLASNTAYGRVAYTLALRLHLDNPFFPQSTTTLHSQAASVQQIEANPELEALDRPPLGGNASVGGTVAHRAIASPNQERLRLGLPVPVRTQQQDGSSIIEKIKYPKPDSDTSEQGLTVVDESEARRLGWNIIEVE
jgi:hypothetical protein